MPDLPIITTGLVFLVPLGYALIAASGLPQERARHVALSIFAALGLAGLGYVATGFALQFGGIGLAYERPGYEGLIWEWSALGPMWGAGWGMVGLTGFGLTGAAATPAAYLLALANLPWAMTAALIPLVSLRGRVPAWAVGLIGLLMGGLTYPLAGNWAWGGWLANLGSNLGLGHGLVDAGGAGLVHLLGAAAALAGILVFTARTSRSVPAGESTPLPRLYLPLLTILGAGLLLIGSQAWIVTNPLLDVSALDRSMLALNITLAAAAAALLPLLYTWLVAGVPDPLMAARGFAAGTVAVMAAAPFIPPWAALAIGGAVGLLTPLAIFIVDHLLRWDDPTAALTVHGLAGALGLLAVGLLADGRFGQGWNGVGADRYLDVARQGITGLLAVAPFKPDWPMQMQAQAVGIAALALFGFFVAWLAIAPLALILRLLGQMIHGHPVPPAGGDVNLVPVAASAPPSAPSGNGPAPDDLPLPDITAEARDLESATENT